MHPRNLHNNGYNFPQLAEACPDLAPFVKMNAYGHRTIDFADAENVKALNRALLQHYYGIDYWDIPEGFLCPPIPGRVDYIHYVADLIGAEEKRPVRMLDIGTGANGIYSILASRVYDWKCTASDIDPLSIENVAKIVANNSGLKDKLDLRLQEDRGSIFKGIIREGEYYDVSVCNPPFHASLEEALKGSQKKLDKLAASKGAETSKETGDLSPKLNFGGQKAELWCSGGEIRFLRRMIKESKDFATQCGWFTTLVSKGGNVEQSMKLMRKVGAADVKQIEMKQGNKITRILAWRFEGGES